MGIQTLILILVSTGFLYFVLRTINKNKILFEQAFMWIIIAFGLIFIGIFDSVPAWFAQLFGFSLTSNFILSIGIFLLMVIIFMHSLTISKYREELKNIVQEISLANKETKDKED